MITNRYIFERLALLMDDHKRIKEISIQVQFMIDYRINKTDIWVDDLHAEIHKLAQYTVQHMKREEDLLFPILKEMYASDEEIIKYIKEEHQQIIARLSLILSSDTNTSRRLLEDIHGIIHDQLEHMFKEENALYPLIRSHFNIIRPEKPF